ncbi:MAG: endopeptidase La [Myxococcales bacterium]|nr:endopeptidase La [Myxococcales bacterium]
MFFHRNDPGDSRSVKGKKGARAVPLLPLRDMVVFPHMVVPLFVGREKSINALEEAMSQDKEILLSVQKKASTQDPKPDEIHTIGTLGTIIQLLRLPDGTVKVLVEGKARASITRFLPNDDFFLCEMELIEEPHVEGIEITALMRSVVSAFENYAKLNKAVAPETVVAVQSIEQPSRLADAVITHLTGVKLQDRQAVLENVNPERRLEQILELLNAELEILQVENKIRSRVKKQMERSQKEYYLNEQMQAIQKELGDRDEFKAEIAEIEEALKKHEHLTEEARTRVQKELKKLRMMQPMSAEATVIRNYIEWILALPWGKRAEVSQDIESAEQILDDDHFGLKKPKERILEYLAVQALVEKLRGPVLCLVGPPGVGKTSLARSISRATGREFVRLSLGGVRDEAEIRGHRRTYIGAMPGRLIQSLRKCQTNNPVFLLDEIDKMSSDYRGDPAAALLEVLDPEQNSTFNDHYLDLDYDLSDVMFVTTANSLSGIPLPLRDRMEIIEISGYTEFEKLAIAQRYLVPRQEAAAGLSSVGVSFTDEAVQAIIHRYTRESGVRNLERQIASVCRKIARRVLVEKNREDQELPRGIVVREPDIEGYLGAPKYQEVGASDRDQIGLTNGLSVSSTGGSVLECEATVVPGKGKQVITGLLEKGMQESAQAAMSYIRSRHKILGLEEDFYTKVDVHVHFPEFVPKDGPSAGITMATSIASALLRIPVRRNVAMTGEITLRGRVKEIGGLKEKMLAAHRAGIDTILIPKENRRDLSEIPGQVLAAMRVVLVEHMDQVLAEALCLNDADALFGSNRVKPLEMREGRFVGEDDDLGDAPTPNAPTPSAEQ